MFAARTEAADNISMQLMGIQRDDQAASDSIDMLQRQRRGWLL
jgi:hypothetical protein